MKWIWLAIAVFLVLAWLTQGNSKEVCGERGICKCIITERQNIVNCSGLNLSAVPENIPTDVTDLYLGRNNLNELQSNVFENLQELQTLYLSYNLLENVPSGLLKNLTELRKVDVSYNHLKNIPGNIFATNFKLQEISLAYNKFEGVDVELFASTFNLEDLDITANRLKEIPGDLLLSTPTLQHLRLCSNQIRAIPEGLFASVRGLEHLTVCKNKLTTINKTALDGSDQLFFLSLYGNELSSLPVDLFSEVTLHGIVFLNNNRLQALADDVFVGTSIQNIYIFSNNLTEISNESLQNDYIREIHLYQNPIRKIMENAFLSRKGSLKLYLQCDELVQQPHFSKNIAWTCLKDRLPPTINIMGIGKRFIRATLIEDGFNCTPGEWGPKCRPCPPGSYGDTVNGCLPCPAGGFYQDDFGSLQCKRCMNGTFVNYAEGKSFESCKLCPLGTDVTRHAGYRACLCKMNYARTHRFKGCSPCHEEGLDCSQDYKSLKVGYYWSWEFPGANITAYSDFVFHLQNDSLPYTITNNQYIYRIPKEHECPLRSSCENAGSIHAKNVAGNCKHGYRGWLCSKCQERFYSILNTCIHCPRNIWIILEIVAVLLLAVALYVFILWQNKKQNEGKGSERSLLDKISSQMKIVLGFYQVVGELFESFHVITWVGPLKLLGEMITFLKVNALRVIIRPHCYSEKLKINAKIQFIISMSFPVAIFVFFVTFYYIFKLYVQYRFRNAYSQICEKLGKLREKLYTYAFLLLFITYPPTCDVIFKLYPGACKTFYIYKEDKTVNITLLRSDYDLNCETLKIYQICAYVATGLYVAPFPFVLLFLLKTHRCKTVTTDFQNEDVDNTENQPESPVSERSYLINEKCVHVETPVWIKFLCENYKPRFWYWEIIELARKVTQTVLVTLLGFEDTLAKVLTIGTSVLFLTLHAKFSPMTSNFEQRLQMFSLSAIFINVLIASVPITPNYQPAISTILIIMNMTIMFVIAGEVVLFITRFIKRRIDRLTEK